MNYKQR